MSRLALLVAAVGIALFLPSSSGPASSASARLVPAAPASPPPRLGILYSDRGQGVVRLSLVPIDPWTLQVRPGRRLALSGSEFDAWSFSRDGSRLAFASFDLDAMRPIPPSVLFVDSRRLRNLGRVQLAESGWVRATAWLPDGRLVAVVQVYLPEVRTDFVTVDATGRKVLERQTFAGQVLRIARTRTRLVVLLAPAESLEPARLAVVESTGAARELVVSEIAAGYEERSGGGAFVQREPGLAVDPDGRRAFVVAADGDVAQVGLGAGAISYHRLSRRVSFLGRLRAWLEPVAAAKPPREGSTRIARWLGGGTIAVSGGDYAVLGTGDRARSRFTAAGLTLIDTRSWTVRKLGEGADTFWPAGDLASEAASTSST